MESVVTSAPGKIILCGEHAVVFGKEAIAFSLNLTTTCSTKILHRPQILHISIPNLMVDQSFNLEDVQALCKTQEIDINNPWKFAYNDGVFDELLSSLENDVQRSAMKIIMSLYMHIANRYVLERNTGLEIAVNTQLPICGGLGSSASFAVSTSSALLLLSGVIPSNQNDWSEENYKLINDWSFQAEKIVHGTPSGIDNSVSTYGQCISFKSGNIERLKRFSNVQLKVLVVNTKRKRNTKDLVLGVKKRKEKLPEVYGSLMDSIEHVTNNFKNCLQQLASGEGVAEIFPLMEDLIDINQNLLNAIGVGHESINEILKICSSFNLHGKLTGAGGGGCVFVLLPPSLSEDRLTEVQEKLNENFSSWVTSLGGDGVLVKSVQPFQC